MPGLISPSGTCSAGYFCSEGAFDPRPDDNDPVENKTGGLCTVGAYCPRGIGAPESCQAGTYQNSPGMTSPSDCVNCPAGSYCAGEKKTAPSGNCTAGYYCTGAATRPNMTAAMPGYYAPNGSASEIMCQQGTFSNTSAKAECDPCPAGRACSSRGLSTNGVACDAGTFCSAGAVYPKSCPIGTFSSSG